MKGKKRPHQEVEVEPVTDPNDAVEFTDKENKSLKNFKKIMVHPMRFIYQRLLKNMGLYDDVMSY